MKQTLYRYNVFAGLVLAILLAGPQNLVALGGIEGTFEYAIDAPWRMEPYTDPATGQRTYGAIPIQISIHDALDVKRDDLHLVFDSGDIFPPRLPDIDIFNVQNRLDLGNVCRVTITELGDAPGGVLGSRTYTFEELAEVETTRGVWPWPTAPIPAPPTLCRRWQGESCVSLQDISQTSEWHALLWHRPINTPPPGDIVQLKVEVEVTRRPETSCDTPFFYEQVNLFTFIPSILTLRNYLWVTLGQEPLPRFDDVDSQWLYGDLHYHSQGTDNEGESAYNYRGVVRAMGAMGLDFVVAAEHASNSQQLIDVDIWPTLIDIDWDWSWPPVSLGDVSVSVTEVGGVLRDMSAQRFAVLHGLLHGAQGVNGQAAWLGASGLPPVTLSHGVIPQIFLGGELDAIPENANAASTFEYGNGLTYDVTQLCGGWLPHVNGAAETCPTAQLFESVEGGTLFRDIQGLNVFDYGREHLIYVPRTAALQVPGETGPGSSAFIPSDTGRYGGAGRRLAYAHNGKPALLPEIERKGYAFVAHHLNAPHPGGNGPDGTPWSLHMLKQAWRSPAILGLQFWNENARLFTGVDSQATDGGPGAEHGYERAFGLPLPVDFAGEGLLNLAGVFELIPYDLSFPRWTALTSVHHQLQHGTADWDQINHWGLDPTLTRELAWLLPGEPRRFLMAGGSDAHGDLNYRREGYLLGTTGIRDTALGLPRNLVQVDRAAGTPVGGGADAPRVYSHETVVQALQRGNFAITDGPALRIVVDRNQNGVIDAEDIPMGDIVHLYGEATLPLLVEWKSTPDFGAVKMIDLYVGAHNGPEGRTYAPYGHGLQLVQGGGLPVGSDTSDGGWTYQSLNDGYWHVGTEDSSSMTSRLRISSGLTSPEPHWEYCSWLCEFPGRLCQQTCVPVSAEFCQNVDRTDPDFNSCEVTGVIDPPQDIPLPQHVYTGIRAVTLDLRAYRAAYQVPGESFFIRAFARTYLPDNCSGVGLERPCIDRYAFTNPVWAITQPDLSTCPDDPQTLDRDEDGLPDGCDPEPDTPRPVQSACQGNTAELREVQVDLTTLTACGSFGMARDSVDATQYIACRAQVLAADAEPYMVCEARDVQGNTLTCLGSAGYVDAVLGMPDYGAVHFTATDDAQGVRRCTALEVETSAPLLP